MKTTRRLSLWALTLLALSLRLAAAERTCAPFPWNPFPWTWENTTCVVTQYWSRPIDLDGDAVPEFWHERFYARQDWNNGLWEDPDRYAVCYQYDDLEAFYPEAQVQLYLPVFGIGGAPLLVDPKLVSGQEIVPVPIQPLQFGITNWVWEVPAYVFGHHLPYTFGLGWLHRHWGAHNVDVCTGWFPPPECGGEIFMGYQPLTFVGTYDGLFGFRLRRPDGWHLGWVQLRQTWSDERYAAKESVLSVSAFAIHPDPDTVILAGQPPQPRLYARVEGAEAVLNWSTAWTGYTLQHCASLSTPDWQPVTGVTNHTLRLPKSAGPAFFRLSQ